MSKFDINFNKLAQLYLPIHLRRLRLLTLARVLMVPFQTLLDDLKNYRKDMDSHLRCTGQTFSLEYALNNAFDGAQRRITIDDIASSVCTIVSKPDPNKEVIIRQTPPTIIYAQGYSSSGTTRFAISIPADLEGERAKIRSFVENYKLPGIKYSITIS